jgi:hypothetical protein
MGIKTTLGIYHVIYRVEPPRNIWAAKYLSNSDPAALQVVPAHHGADWTRQLRRDTGTAPLRLKSSPKAVSQEAPAAAGLHEKSLTSWGPRRTRGVPVPSLNTRVGAAMSAPAKHCAETASCRRLTLGEQRRMHRGRHELSLTRHLTTSCNSCAVSTFVFPRARFTSEHLEALVPPSRESLPSSLLSLLWNSDTRARRPQLWLWLLWAALVGCAQVKLGKWGSAARTDSAAEAPLAKLNRLGGPFSCRLPPASAAKQFPHASGSRVSFQLFAPQIIGRPAMSHPAARS